MWKNVKSSIHFTDIYIYIPALYFIIFGSIDVQLISQTIERLNIAALQTHEFTVKTGKCPDCHHAPLSVSANLCPNCGCTNFTEKMSKVLLVKKVRCVDTSHDKHTNDQAKMCRACNGSGHLEEVHIEVWYINTITYTSRNSRSVRKYRRVGERQYLEWLTITAC